MSLEKRKNTSAMGKFWANLHGNICYWLLIIGTRWKFAHICPWSRSLKSFPENRIPII